ncbi:MAG TPA: YceI family protein [Gemmatimonadales bacterium]|nr:YceI family protein [Gemmatimonadales bacterium]
MTSWRNPGRLLLVIPLLAGLVGFAGWGPQPRPPAGVKLTVLPTGNEVRYRVREQLVNVDLPNDAIGRTGAITGGLALDATGAVVTPGSQFVIAVGGLTSDRDRRDGYVRNRLLEAGQYPNVTFVPTAVSGVTLPLPASGEAALTIAGDLTVKGVTHPVVWQGRAIFAPGQVSGTASTAFTFGDFGLTKPRVPVLLSVQDTIRLEYDFTLGVEK